MSSNLTASASVCPINERAVRAAALAGLAMPPAGSSATASIAPAALKPATSGAFGLLPAAGFRLASGTCTDCQTIPQALWFFRNERIAVPLPEQPLAGFSRTRRYADDVAEWNATTRLESVPTAPPLVWTAADHLLHGAKISADGTQLTAGGEQMKLTLTPRHPLNRAWFDASSIRFFHGRPLRIRGDWQDGNLVARTLWPEDFRLAKHPAARPMKADPLALRARLRELPDGGAQAPFAVDCLWQRSSSAAVAEGQPVIAFILNGAQGDDDEAHGGHFAIATGRIGTDGAIADWLVANYYTLDAESEKGIVAAAVPLDNYLADLNAGQAWYRPSCMLVAVLRDERTAVRLQSALARVFNQFYRHQFSYQHARANCAGISVTTLRALGWQIPAAGPEGWVKAFFALPLASLAARSLRKGKAVFDYLTEDRTRLYPAVAFEQIGAELLRLASGVGERRLGGFESMLAEDLDAVLFVRVPQLPSSRAWGSHPIVDSREYRQRVPRNPADRQIVPVGPRPFPRDFIDPQAPGEPPLRSDYALIAYTLLLLLLVVAWLY